MKTKILGLLAMGLLAGPMAANASYLYTLADSATSPTNTVTFTSADFITTTSLFSVTSSISGVTFGGASRCGDGIAFAYSDDSTLSTSPCLISVSGDAFLGFSSFSFVPQSVGSFTAFTSRGLPYLTISSVGSVPEPGTLALLGLGLAGLGLSRRRKAN